MSDNFSHRMKNYEKIESGRRFMPLLPIYARIDGRSFSRFTKRFNRPYDEEMVKAMTDTTKYLVNETDALIGYTQSDEISLCWLSKSIDSQIFFDGKIQKMVSVLAALTTVKFNKCCQANTKLTTAADKLFPVFDCRVFQLPNKIEATNTFLWREQDATKNAISMAARCMFSHKQLMNKSRNEMQEMMWQEYGIIFNDYPIFFKRGTFVRRELIDVKLTADEYANIPEAHRPNSMFVKRHRIVELDMPKFSTVTNRVEVIFDGADPIVGE